MVSAFGPHDLALVRLVEAGEHAQQRRLAGAVGTAQADAIAIADLPRDVIEQHAIGELFVELLELDHQRVTSWRSCIQSDWRFAMTGANSPIVNRQSPSNR